MLSIVEYGAVLNDQTMGDANFTALLAAFTAAQATSDGGVISVPSGSLYVNFPVSDTGVQIAAGAPVTLRGEGQETTRLVTQDSLSGNTFFFTVAPGGVFALENMSLYGPTATNTYVCRGVDHLGTEGALTLRHVSMTNFLTPVYAQSGANVTLWVEACQFSNVGVAPTSFQVAAQNILRARILNCDFRGYGLPNTNQAHAIYVYQGVDVEVRGCTFDSAYGIGLGIHLYGGSGISPHAVVDDCEFGPGSYRGVLTNATVRTQVRGCRFLGAGEGILAQFDADIADCVFSNAAPVASPVTLTTASGQHLRVLDCRFDLPSSGTYAVNLAKTNSSAMIADCSFGCGQAFCATAVATSTYQLFDCDFADDGTGHWLLRGTSGVPALGGIATGITNASVTGNDIRGYAQFDATIPLVAGKALFTLSFAHAYGATPYVQVTNQTSDRQMTPCGVSAVSATGFTIHTLTPLSPATQLRISYLIAG